MVVETESATETEMPAAKKKSAPAQVIVLPGQPEEDVDERSDEEKETDEELGRATSELSSRMTAKLFRAHPATGNREAFVDSIPADTFTQDYVRENYGGGRFRVLFHGKRRDGKVGFIKQDRFEIDATIPPKVPGVAQPGQVQHAQPSASMDAAVVTMLTTMMTQVASQAQASASAQASLMSMQMTMMKDHSAAMQAQLAKLGERPPERDTLGEMAKMVTMMRDLNPPGPARSLKEELETMSMLKELMGENNSSETSWLDVIKEVAPTLIQAGAKRDGIVPARPVRTGLKPGEVRSRVITGTEAGAEVPAKTETEPNVNPNIRFIAPIMPRVLKWAAQGNRTPGQCADWLLADIPIGFYPMLREQLSADTFMTDIESAFPAVEPFRPWIMELRSELLKATEPEDDDATIDDEEDDEPPG